MWISLVIAALLMGLAATAFGQDTTQLILTDTKTSSQPDGFGGERPVVSGAVFNHGAQAYRNISITVEAYSADETLIGEGFGFLVDACGTALLDHVLVAGRGSRHSARPMNSSKTTQSRESSRASMGSR